MITDYLDFRLEQNTLKEVVVLCYHGDHVDIPTFGKGLNRGV